MLYARLRKILVYPLLIFIFVMGTGVTPALAAEAPPGQPQAGAQPEAAQYQVKQAEEHWTMEDGTKLPVWTFCPMSDEAGATFPLIVFVHGAATDGHMYDGMATDYASKGYVCVTYTARGWYAAEGQNTCMDPESELKDLSRIITLASEDPDLPVLWDEKGPVVGVTGYSMGGVHSYLIAPRKNPRPGDPGDPRVRAVVPQHGGADLIYTIIPNGAVKLFFALVLMGVFYMGNVTGFALNVLQIAFKEGMAPWDKLSAILAAMGKLQPLVSNVTPFLAGALDTVLNRKLEDEEAVKQYFKVRSARYWCDEEFDGVVEHPITAPMLILTGWQDDLFYANEGLRISSTCMDAPGRIIITNHGHAGGTGGNIYNVPLPVSPELDWVNEQIKAWFDHYLKGEDNGVEEEPRLAFYRDRDPGNYGEADSYPLPGTRQDSLYLGDKAGGEGNLSTSEPASSQQADFLLNIGITGSVSIPYFQDITEVFGGQTMDIPRKIDLLELPFTERGYTSDPLPADVTIMGAPMLELYYQSSAPFAQLNPWVSEVAPDGTETIVSRGWYEGHNENMWTMTSTAGQPIEMQACYHRFPKGSRIKLELDTADLILTWPYLNPSFILLHHGQDAASRLVLPVVPNSY